MILVSFAEILSIGAVLPFLGVLTAPNRVFELPAAQPAIHFFSLVSPDQLLLPLTIVFGIAALAAGAMRLLFLWASTRVAFAAGADLSLGIYRRTLYQPYAVHIARNSSEIINGISSKTYAVIYSIIMPALTIVSAGVMLGAILFALLSVNPVIAFAAFGGFGAIYGLIIWLTRGRLLAGGQHMARESTRVIKSLQEGLGGIRDVLIDGSQEAYCDVYRNADIPLRRAQSSNLFISQCPRYGMEAFGMLLIAVLAYVLAREPDGIANAIPMLGALALGAQRLLPTLQQVYGAWASIRGGQPVLSDALDLLDQPLPAYASHPAPPPLPFKFSIELKNLSFRHSPQTAWALKNINLKIAKGSRVGFVGVTGAGKSTLSDIIMALLHSSEGGLEVDGQPITNANYRAWQANIAHVPQDIFLADSTVEENIAFGLPAKQIDRERVRLAAKQAQISDTIEAWPKQYKTLVGERGNWLSGGQRQRIGIARALYKRADVIIFDEATSALDSETEQAVMQAIENLNPDLTILVIAHRIGTLKGCAQIVELDDGEIKRIGAYHDIVSRAG